MPRIFAALTLAGCGLCSYATNASAALLAYEPFDYAPGLSEPLFGTGIDGLNGGFGFTGGWVSGGSQLSGIAAESDEFFAAGARTSALAYQDSFGNPLATSGNQVRTAAGSNSWERRILAQPIGEAGSTVWVSFLGQAHANAGTSRYAFVELSNGGTGNRAWLGNVTPVASGNWGMQLPDDSTGSLQADAGAPYEMSVQTFFLMKLEFPAEETGETGISVWLNPANITDELSLSVPTMSFNTDYTEYTHLGVAGRYSTDFDELRIGTDFGSVTPVPEPATYGLLLGFATLGLLLLRRWIQEGDLE